MSRSAILETKVDQNIDIHVLRVPKTFRGDEDRNLVASDEI